RTFVGVGARCAMDIAGPGAVDAACRRKSENTRAWKPRSRSGWETEFEDPVTGELWLMDLPHSELQGGGPPRLRRSSGGISAFQVTSRWTRPAVLARQENGAARPRAGNLCHSNRRPRHVRPS